MFKKKDFMENVQETFTPLGEKANPYTYVKDADYITLFSNFEGYGMVIDEAKVLKKNILITHTAAIEALTDYREYSKVCENSEKGIKNTIIEAIDNKSKNTRKNIVYDYTNAKIIDKIIKIIEE